MSTPAPSGQRAGGGRWPARRPPLAARWGRVGGGLHNLLSMAREKPIRPEVIEPDSKLPSDLVALRKFAYLMDEALPVPGTHRRIGIDAGVGLIPGIGDAIGAILSAWIIVGALRHRVPLLHVMRMLFYVLLDLVIGEIPLLGDLFDWLFEENVINLKILMQYRDRGRPPRSFAAIAGVTAVILLVIIGVAIITLIALVAAALWLIHHR